MLPLHFGLRHFFIVDFLPQECDSIINCMPLGTSSCLHTLHKVIKSVKPFTLWLYATDLVQRKRSPSLKVFTGDSNMASMRGLPLSCLKSPRDCSPLASRRIFCTSESFSTGVVCIANIWSLNSRVNRNSHESPDSSICRTFTTSSASPTLRAATPCASVSAVIPCISTSASSTLARPSLLPSLPPPPAPASISFPAPTSLAAIFHPIVSSAIFSPSTSIEAEPGEEIVE
mmetsp:Transcript_28948/g.46535  ORF Transcript_28948/g.46535 Transcript_28948/m.46535 type:complete len:230 (+) Transcript_28948:5420-6109(+)